LKKARIFAFILATFIAMPLFALPAEAAPMPQIHAETFVLMEATNGRILTENGAHRRMFPAATTMILTAILAYEHIDMDEIIIAGSEVGNLPFDSARNHHEVGEAILGINLIRGMLIGAGNDTANIVALNVARRASGNTDMPFSEAQHFFAGLMMERARDLGALDSRFTNPHGYHHDNHFTTAYDLAQIAHHALSIPTIAQIASEARFSGAMAGEAETPEGAVLRNRTWNSPNSLIRPDMPDFYPYATGLRTGHTGLAGDTLMASAYRNGITLIVVTLNSPRVEDVQTRWQDGVNLFEYGFENFAYRTLLTVGYEPLGQMDVYNPRLGDYDYLEFYNARPIDLFLSQAELGRLETVVEFLEEFIIFDEYDTESTKMFAAPIGEGQIIGTISHILDGEVLFYTDIYAAREVLQRTTASDIDYHMANVQRIFFSRQSIPYWVAGLSVAGLLMVVIFGVRRRIRETKSKHGKYKMRL